LIGALASTNLFFDNVYAQVAPDTPKASDPAITNLWAINSMPAPNGVVDFTVFYGNLGTTEPITNATLKVDYDETKLYDISLGDSAACTDDKSVVTCSFNTLDPGYSNTVGFTARVMPTVPVDTIISFTASIKGDSTENDVRNDFANLSVTVTAPEKGGKLGPTMGANLEAEPLEQAAKKGSVWLFDVSQDPNWKIDTLSTLGLKFMIRGKEALAWTLNIKDSGFHNSAIRDNYLKVLTVVNNLFIIGLLAIAAMWMFSLFIPRRYLRQVIVLYGAAVIFVNFALPLNQLFIDGSNLLQKTFIGATNISDLVETPSYSDPTAISYQNETDALKKATSQKFSLNVGSQEEQAVKDVIVGKLQQGSQTPVLTGTLTSFDAEGKPRTQIIELQSTGNDPVLHLAANQSVELVDEKTFNPNEEHRLFSFLMMLLTGVAYFGMALTFVFRIVILWALMIVSPMLFLLAIFKSTRSYFYHWLSMYARWILIGPLMALGIAMVVGIWQTVGLPITSAYAGFGQFGQLTNLGFFLPGASAANNLSTTPQMMQYLLFLIMLYLPLALAFMLTRQKMLGAGAQMIVERISVERAPTTVGAAEAPKALTPIERARQLTTGVRGLFEAGAARFAKAAMPMTLRATEPKPLATGTAALPEQLALTPMRDMLTLASGEPEGARNIHSKAVEQLAAAPAMTDSPERQNLMAVRHEIEERASGGDAEATRVITEIREQEQTPTGGPMGGPIGGPIGELTEVTVKSEKEPNLPQSAERKQELEMTTSNNVKPEKDSRKQKSRILQDEEEEDERNREEAERISRQTNNT